MTVPTRYLQVLDIISNGASSFAAVYGGLSRHYPGPEGTSVRSVWELVSALEKGGLVGVRSMLPNGGFGKPSEHERARALAAYEGWLPHATLEDLSVDEVGIWLELEPRGRAAWENWAGTGNPVARWTLDQDERAQTMTVHAEDLDTADGALGDWLNANPSIELLPETRRIEPVLAFSLRDRSVVQGGICLRVRYRRSRR